jgi:hypothetical protein
MISSSDAALLMSKWKSESKRLRIFLISRDKFVNLRLTASVSDIVERERLTLVAPNGDHCLVVLHGCRFEYGDPREAPEAVRNAVAEKFEGTLTVLFPSGDRLYLLEMRDDIPT